jgi:hypothetical protein
MPFPDVTNIQVQIATEAPGRSPEEVERFRHRAAGSGDDRPARSGGNALAEQAGAVADHAGVQ